MCAAFTLISADFLPVPNAVNSKCAYSYLMELLCSKSGAIRKAIGEVADFLASYFSTPPNLFEIVRIGFRQAKRVLPA